MATITLRLKEAEFDFDPLAKPPKISRFAIAYDLVVAGVTTSKVWSGTPDQSHEFQLWLAVRDLLKPLLAAEGVSPPPLPRPDQ